MQSPFPRYFSHFIFSCLIFLLPLSANAMLSMELTRGVAGAIPISVMPFAVQGSPSQDVSAIISNDLRNSGRFSVSSGGSSSDAVVSGSLREAGSGKMEVNFELRDGYQGKKTSILLLHRTFTVGEMALRAVAHHISDLVYEKLTGVKGVFSTRLAYVVVKNGGTPEAQYTLEMADQDGYNPRPLLISPDPVMSPAFSPDGRHIAYVSFEKKHAAIYLQEVASGNRAQLSAFPGINGAPAFSPDGKKLALVLSRSGSPNIYMLDIATRHLTQLTHDWSINTEPAFAPDGRTLVFTSNRGGGPQIYQLKLSDGSVTRLTWDGNYNARASFTPDGRHIVVINQTSGLFNIAMLDLDTGVFKVLTGASGTDNESPALAPNGSMVLYGTVEGGRNVLGMASTDGSVQIRLPGREGEVQDPAWSPWVS